MIYSNFKELSNSDLKEVNGGVPTGGGAWTVTADEFDHYPTNRSGEEAVDSRNFYFHDL